jgi:MoaA/NifB/PqqE/SkfB family radical SAM enzyme
MAGRSGYRALIRDRVRAPEFQSLFLFVTSRCNARCRTCFYYDKLNRNDDLTCEEIRRISATAPPFRKLWISGGEPFLRDELGEILTMFAARNGVRNINLPTNGLLPERIFRAMDCVLASCPDVSVDLNFSLDGLGATHDRIRGVPNNFARTLETIHAVTGRYRGERRLRRNAVTVITRENQEEVVRLGEHLAASADLDGHYFEVARGQMPDLTLKEFSRNTVASLHERLAPLHRHYAHRLFAHLPVGVRHVAQVYYLGNLRLHYDLHEGCLDGPAPWPMRCTAGESALVIDHNGDFRACEMRGVLGNLRTFDFDVRAALGSPEVKAEVAAIPGANCWCTHSCFIQDSSKFSATVQLVHIPAAGLRASVIR